mmetsp:Transcript_25714/g.21564  ORF Transcript_25714/g.21564 Transcript_25714/m.21564 type:complete len:214 (+) Transcript_25714:111-752(+)
MRAISATPPSRRELVDMTKVLGVMVAVGMVVVEVEGMEVVVVGMAALRPAMATGRARTATPMCLPQSARALNARRPIPLVEEVEAGAAITVVADTVVEVATVVVVSGAEVEAGGMVALLPAMVIGLARRAAPTSSPQRASAISAIPRSSKPPARLTQTGWILVKDVGAGCLKGSNGVGTFPKCTRVWSVPKCRRVWSVLPTHHADLSTPLFCV